MRCHTLAVAVLSFAASISGKSKATEKADVDFLNVLNDWRVDRYLECTFCIDYDNYMRISMFGCDSHTNLRCKGNVCFMRQHKSSAFFLYTSGCLNLTQDGYDHIMENMKKREREKPGRKPQHPNVEPTHLCEVVSRSNTCVCSNANDCNDVSKQEPFVEYDTPILDLEYNELLQFRYFVPHEPVIQRLDTRKVDEILKKHYIPQFTDSKQVDTYSTVCTIIFLLLRYNFCVASISCVQKCF